MTQSLNRREVESIAACVAACNDGGVLDDLIEKLRALWAWIPARGSVTLPDGPARESGTPQPVVGDVTGMIDSDATGGEREAAPERTAVESGAILHSGPPSAPDSPPVATDPRARLRPETYDRIARGDHPQAKHEQHDDQRRRRRTRAVGKGE